MATLKQGITRAKQLQKKHPRMKWTDCVKLAHKQLGKSKPAKKAKPAKKRAAKKVSGVTRSVGKIRHTKTVSGSGQTLSGVRSTGMALLKTKYGNLATKKAMARTKTAKKKLQKQMSAILSNLRKLKSI
jgi:hypothetical protein